MQENENVKSVVEAVLTNWKIGASVGVGTAATGVASQQSIIHGWLTDVAIAIGIATSLLVFGIKLIEFEKKVRERLAERNES